MKNLTKKRGLFAAAAALLVVTVMLGITWCSNDIGSKPDEFTPPAGKGAVMLSFNKDVSRKTIMPGPGSISSIDDFDEFQITFTPAAPTATGTLWDERVDKANLHDAIILDPGTYTLTIVGYIDYDQLLSIPTNTPDLRAEAQTSEPVSVTIAAGTIAHKTVVLRLIMNGTDEGTFRYTLDDDLITPADITSATMTLTPIKNGDTVAPISIKSEFDNTPRPIMLKTGIYDIKFELTVGGDTVTFTHVVHIYKDMISDYTFKIGLNYFNAVFQFGSNEITFNDSDMCPVIEYSTDGTNFTAVPILSPIASPFSRNTVITFRVNPTTDYTANSFEWYCLDNTALTNTSYPPYCTISSNTTTCTIDTTRPAYPTNNPFSAARFYNLTVVGLKGGQKYATIVEYSVTP